MSKLKSLNVVPREERRRLAVEWMAESRRRQGLPPTIPDPVALAKLATLFRSALPRAERERAGRTVKDK